MTNEVKQPKRKEPLFHLVKRAPMPWYGSIGIRIATIAAALLFCSLLSWLFMDKQPSDMFTSMWDGAFGTDRRIWKLAKDLAILLCISLAVTPAFRMRFWNIGAEGQVLVGALSAVASVIWFGGKVSEPLLLVIMFVFAVVGAGVWALVPAIFKAQWDTNETLFTLMMNYVATYLVAFCLFNWVPSGNTVLGSLENGHLPSFYHDYMVIVLAVALLTVLVYVYLNYTKHGYEISVVGESKKTACYIGINVKKVIVRTMIVSGVLCGIAGYLIVAGLDHSVTETTVGGRGFTAIMVSWLAKFNPLYMVATSLLIVFLNQGASRLSQDWNISNAYPNMIVGIILFFIIGCEFFINYQIKFRTKQKGGK